MHDNSEILVLGSTGQLGKSIYSLKKKYPDIRLSFAGRNDFDMCDNNSLRNFFNKKEFGAIVNCAAFTSVDGAETESFLANQVNNIAVRNLALVAKEKNCKLIHISTDYVFNGLNCKPYVETDLLDPVGEYGKSKLLGEQAIFETLERDAIIIRTSWLYSEFGNNFLNTMLRLGEELDSIEIIFDQTGTPTYAKDLAEAILKIVESNCFGRENFKTSVFHYSNEGVGSWYDFAKAIFDITGLKCQAIPIESKDYPSPAKRPSYSVLNKDKIKTEYKLTIPHWRESLEKCIFSLNDKPI